MNLSLEDLHKGLPLAQGRVGLLGLPYDGESSFFRGPSAAPPIIRAALFSEVSHLWSENGLDLGAGSLFDAGDLGFKDAGRVQEDISEAIRLMLGQGYRPFSLGGDHSISFPILRALREAYPRLSVVQFDAHPDLYDQFEGSRSSHACPFARIMEAGLADRLVQIGIRTANGHQREQARKFGVEMVEMRHWRDDLELKLEGPVYVSCDLDVFDPAYAPGISHQEPGGLTPRQVINLMHRLEARVVGADVVEYNPFRDIGNMTAMLAAKLVKELAAKMLASKQ